MYVERNIGVFDPSEGSTYLVNIDCRTRCGEPVIGARERDPGIKKEVNEAATAMEDDGVVKLDENGVHRTSVAARETPHVIP